MVFSFTKAAALLLVGSMGAEAASAATRVPAGHDRMLRAATRRSDHLKRTLRIEQKFDNVLHYVEEPTRYDGHSVFASQLKVASKKPILTLEEIEHHLADVQCSSGKIALRFFDTSSAIDARLACHGSDGGIVITSHEGCNKNGERTVYTVHGASSTGDGSILELSVAESLFEHAFDRLEVGFGHTEEHHYVREHEDFKLHRRQLADMQRLANGASDLNRAAKVAKNASEVLGDVPDNTDPNVNQAKFNIDWEVTNKTFRPDEFLMGLPVGWSVTNIVNLPVVFTCKKCLTMGEIVLSQGNIQIDVEALKGIPDKIKAIPGMVASAIPSLVNEIPGKIDDAAEELKDAAAPAVSVIDAAPSKIESVAAGVTSAAASIIDAAPSKIESIVDKIPSLLPDVPDVPDLPDLPDIKLPDINPFGRRGVDFDPSHIQPDADRRRKRAKRADFNLGNVITGGFVELKANGLEAYFEISAKPKETGMFMFRLLELPILGFTIPGVGRAGAVFEALLEADYEMEGGFEMSYGMNLVVPSNSSMRVDLGDMSKSGVTGFQDSTLTPLPFTFEQKQLDAFVSVAMVPSIPIGFKFLSVLDVGVDVDMDLPRLDAMISTIHDADTQCNDLSYEDEEFAEEGDEEFAEEGDEEFAEEGDEEFAEEGDEEFAEEGDEEFAEEGDEEFAEEGDEEFAEEGDEELAEEGEETDPDLVDEEADADFDEETDPDLVDEETDADLVDEETDADLVDEDTDLVDEDTDADFDEETDADLVDEEIDPDLVDEETDTDLIDEETDSGLVDEETDVAKLKRAVSKRSVSKRSVSKRHLQSLKSASKARRLPASSKARQARNLRRQAETPFPLSNGTANSTQPDKLSLVYVEWNVSMIVELGFNFVLPGMPMMIPGVDVNAINPFKPMRKHKTVYSTVKTMPTMCLAPEKGFRPATDVYTDPVETDVGTIGTGAAPIGTGVGASGTPKFTAIPTSDVTDFKLRKREYGYGVAIPPYTPTLTPEIPSPTPTPTPASEATPPPPEVTPVESMPPVECGGYGQPPCGESAPPPPEVTPVESMPPVECGAYGQPACEESAPPPPEVTPVESMPPVECGAYGQPACEESAPPPPEVTPVESMPPVECGGYGQPACEEASAPPPPPPETTPTGSNSTEVPPPPQKTLPVESSSAEIPPTEPTPVESTSTPCTTTMPPPELPTSPPCTKKNTITVTLPYNNTTPGYAPPSGTAMPPIPSKPSEFTGAAAMMMPGVGVGFLVLLAALML